MDAEMIGGAGRDAACDGVPAGEAGRSSRLSGQSRPIRVLVADDQALLRGSFRVLIDTAPDLRTVAEAGTGEEAVALARRELPDVVLMDVRMPGIVEYLKRRLRGLGSAQRPT